MSSAHPAEGSEGRRGGNVHLKLTGLSWWKSVALDANTLSSVQRGRAAVVAMLKAFLRGKSKTPALSSQSLFLADDLQTNPLAGTLEQSDTHAGRGEPHYFKRDDSLWIFSFFFFREDKGKNGQKKCTLFIKEAWSWHIGNKYRQWSTLICPWKCMQARGTSVCQGKFNLQCACIKDDPARNWIFAAMMLWKKKKTVNVTSWSWSNIMWESDALVKKCWRFWKMKIKRFLTS